MTRVEAAVAHELALLARAQSNIEAAVEDGRISAADGEERAARAEQWTANRIAWIKGEPRPRQRERRPLENPDAGRVA
jgi:hypothetical protein